MTDNTSCNSETSCSSCSTSNQCDSKTQQIHMEQRLAEKLGSIKHRLMIMSGKGGVGKSTVAVNLAVALANLGKIVGVLDGDVHGPNVPKMFGIDREGLRMGEHGLLPAVAPGNVKVMSMAFMLQEDDTPVAWRGPLKHSLFQQFLSDVDWGVLDYLVVDLPPGTGDEPMSIAQILGKPLWTIVVTTPQDVALLDSRKSVVFGKNLEMTVLGIVENMSGLVCPHCGEMVDLFKRGGGERSARDLGVPFLGAIPIDPVVVTGGDSGVPISFLEPGSPTAEAFRKLASTIDKVISDGDRPTC